MNNDTLAVYENGKPRPLQSLPLDEGETVRVTVVRAEAKPNPGLEEINARMRSAGNLQELFAAFESGASGDENYDLLEALDANRAGERKLYPLELKGVTW